MNTKNKIVLECVCIDKIYMYILLQNSMDITYSSVEYK